MPVLLIFLVLVAVTFPGDLHAGWQEIPLMDLNGRLFSASSELDGPPAEGLGKYGPHNLFDNDPKTCWAEGGAGNGVGEVLFIGIEGRQQELFVRNGYGKSRNHFKKNGRIKTLSVSLLAGVNPPGFATESHLLFQALPLTAPFSRRLEDTMDIQRVPLGIDWQKVRESQQEFIDKAAARLAGLKIPHSRKDLQPGYILRLEIRAVYPGAKYSDTCLSGIRFMERPERIYLSQAEDAILVDTDLRKRRVLIKDSASVFLLLDQTDDNMWLIAHKMPRQGGGGRVEVEEMLFHVGLGRRVDNALLGTEFPQLYGFKGGKLQYGKGAVAPDVKIDLKLLRRMMRNIR